MSLKVVPAILHDLEKIQELNSKLFRNEIDKYDDTLDPLWTTSAGGEEYFRNRIAGTGGCVFVAKNDEIIVGYIAGGLADAPAHRKLRGHLAELENMFVEDEFRSRGVGSMLIEAFLDWCKKNKCERVKVVASASNMDGIKFYERNDFKPFELILEKDI